MTQNDDTAASAFSAVFRSPWAQGVVTGVLTLIPARNYPRWLRLSTIWGPTVIAGVGAVCLGANPERARKLSEKLGGTGQSGQPEFRSQPEPPGGLRGAALTLVPAAAIGAVLSGSMAAAYWADEKLEGGLRRLRVPFPRAVMGLASGAATGWMVTKENERERAQQNR